MKTQSAKAKGRLLQQYVVKQILKHFPDLEDGDAVSTSMGAAGTDVRLSPKAKRLLPYDIECKSLAKFVGYTYLDQAISRLKEKEIIPLAVVKANRRQPVVVVDLGHFLELVNARRNSSD